MDELILPFQTYAGKVQIEPTNETMTPFGGLVPWAAFTKKTGIFEALAQNSPAVRTSNNALSVYDIITSFSLTTLCDGTHFSDVNRLRHDPAIPELFGMKRVASDDTVRRFFKSIDIEDARSWIAGAASPICSALPNNYIVDWDSTIITRYGQQEDAVVGYNPTKRGRPSHHPLLAVVANTRLCLHYSHRPGNAASSTDCIDAMKDALDYCGEKHRPLLNRGDIGFGHNKIMSWHETTVNAPYYLFKLKITNNVRRAFAKINEDDWHGTDCFGVLQTAEKMLQLPSWDRPRRVVFGRRLQGLIPAEQSGKFWDTYKHEYEAYITDLPVEEANSWQIVDLYRKRADCENVFDELKNQWGFAGFCAHDANVTEIAARLLLLTYNLWTLFCRLMCPGKHIEAVTGRRWYLLIAAQLVTSGRQRTMKISVSQQWLKDLLDGYNRVLNWLNSTAPQLDYLRKFSLPETIPI
jgi:hypothetical protein